MQSLPLLDPISAKMDQLKSHLQVVGVEHLATVQSSGRVVSQNVCAFRDSPATDVSAMDGYAVRLADIDGNPLPVIATATAGSVPQQLATKSAIRVFTGGPVPAHADVVIRREDCNESTSHVTIQATKETIALGLNIRRKGENAREGDTVLPRGSELTASRFAGAMTFFKENVIEVFKKVQVHIINTGDELIEFGQPVEPWQIRDSNGPFLESILAKQTWLETKRTKVSDQRAKTELAIRNALAQSDVLLLTGGVSMGDTDYVPDSIRSAGGQVVFHRIPIRPGRPMLGAYGPRGQLILGLPGNPLSVAVTFRRYALELMRHVGGFSGPTPVPMMPFESSDAKTTDLTWFRIVKWSDEGRLSLVTSQGSGDIASLIQSDGFVEIPPNNQATGTRKFYAWQL